MTKTENTTDTTATRDTIRYPHSDPAAIFTGHNETLDMDCFTTQASGDKMVYDWMRPQEGARWLLVSYEAQRPEDYIARRLALAWHEQHGPRWPVEGARFLGRYRAMRDLWARGECAVVSDARNTGEHERDTCYSDSSVVAEAFRRLDALNAGQPLHLVLTGRYLPPPDPATVAQAVQEAQAGQGRSVDEIMATSPEEQCQHVTPNGSDGYLCCALKDGHAGPHRTIYDCAQPTNWMPRGEWKPSGVGYIAIDVPGRAGPLVAPPLSEILSPDDWPQVPGPPQIASPDAPPDSAPAPLSVRELALHLVSCVEALDRNDASLSTWKLTNGYASGFTWKQILARHADAIAAIKQEPRATDWQAKYEAAAKEVSALKTDVRHWCMLAERQRKVIPHNHPVCPTQEAIDESLRLAPGPLPEAVINEQWTLGIRHEADVNKARVRELEAELAAIKAKQPEPSVDAVEWMFNFASALVEWWEAETSPIDSQMEFCTCYLRDHPFPATDWQAKYEAAAREVESLIAGLQAAYDPREQTRSMLLARQFQKANAELAALKQKCDDLQREIDSGGTKSDCCCHGNADITPAALESLKAELESERACREPMCNSPCGHSSQYAFSSDGGKTIVCLQCRSEELAAIKAVPRKEVWVECEHSQREATMLIADIPLPGTTGGQYKSLPLRRETIPDVAAMQAEFGYHLTVRDVIRKLQAELSALRAEKAAPAVEAAEKPPADAFDGAMSAFKSRRRDIGSWQGSVADLASDVIDLTEALAARVAKPEGGKSQ